MSNYPTAHGPTWGLYQADVGAANDRADRNADAAKKWKAHAEKMKADLDAVWDLFHKRAAAEDAQAELKREALSEINKLDPLNKMLNTGYRQKLYDEAYAKSLAEQKKKN